MTNTKFCTKCGEGLPATTEYFYTDKHAKSGLRPDCKICSKKRVIEYNLKNKQKRIENHKQWRKNNPHKEREYYLKRKYGITPKEYNEMYDKQYGKCAICGVHQSELERVFCVDHDHKTGEIRGLLCNDCNSVLGYCKDNQFILLKSIEYLSG